MLVVCVGMADLWVLGVERVIVASRRQLRDAGCRPACALVGAAAHSNGLGMALFSPSTCRSLRE